MIWPFLPHFVYNTNEEIDAAHRATFIVENQLRMNLTVYLTVIVNFLPLQRYEFQILIALIDHRVGVGETVATEGFWRRIAKKIQWFTADGRYRPRCIIN